MPLYWLFPIWVILMGARSINHAALLHSQIINHSSFIYIVIDRDIDTDTDTRGR